MNSSGSAWKALDAVKELGGETSSHAVSRKLGTEPGFARLLCLDLARKDYLDFKPSGLFRMTRKGEQTLNGESSAPRSSSGKTAARKGRLRHESGWRKGNNGKMGPGQHPSFPKPGQEPLCWQSVQVNGTGNAAAGPGTRTATVFHEGSWPCGFCRGKGERPAGAKCAVCRGAGVIDLSPPVARCAFCKGKGEEKVRSGVTCTVCRGKGYVEVADSATVCARCAGTGKEKNSKLPCLGCKGKGLVGERPARPPQAKESPVGRHDLWQREELQLKIKEAGTSRPGGATPSGTELQVLRAYCAAEDAGEAPDVPRRTGLSHGYVETLRQSLLSKGLLVGAGPRRYRVSNAGRETAAPKGAGCKE